MAAAQKRVGVVVVDMQSANPSKMDIILKLEELDSRRALQRKLGPEGMNRLWLWSKTPRKEIVFNHSTNREITAIKHEGGGIKFLIHFEWRKRVYSNVEKLLREADRLRLPIALLEYQPADEKQPPLNPALVAAAGKRAKRYVKKDTCGGSNRHFAAFVKKNMDEAIVVGFNRNECVYDTAEYLRKEMNVISCAQLLIGSPSWKRSFEQVSRFYKEKTEYYRRLDDLLSALKEKLSLH